MFFLSDCFHLNSDLMNSNELFQVVAPLLFFLLASQNTLRMSVVKQPANRMVEHLELLRNYRVGSVYVQTYFWGGKVSAHNSVCEWKVLLCPSSSAF